MPGMAFGLAALLGTLSGCQNYNWRYDYVQAEADAQKTNRPLFIFYKWWLDDDSNRMLSNEVLSDPQVVAEFQDSVNVLVERAAGSEYVEYMKKFGVDNYPAAVIVAPGGRYHVRVGLIPKDRFLEFIRQAKSTMPAAGSAKTSSTQK